MDALDHIGNEKDVAAGNAPWGTHLCQVYQSKNDLLDIVIPYLTTALQSDVSCIYVARSTQDMIIVEEGLRGTLGDITKYKDTRQLQIYNYQDFLLTKGVFDTKNH